VYGLWKSYLFFITWVNTVAFFLNDSIYNCLPKHNTQVQLHIIIVPFKTHLETWCFNNINILYNSRNMNNPKHILMNFEPFMTTLLIQDGIILVRTDDVMTPKICKWKWQKHKIDLLIYGSTYIKYVYLIYFSNTTVKMNAKYRVVTFLVFCL